MTALYRPKPARPPKGGDRCDRVRRRGFIGLLTGAAVRPFAGVSARRACVTAIHGLETALNGVQFQRWSRPVASRLAIDRGRAAPTAGSPLSCGVELSYSFRRAASDVDRISCGARAGGRPVQAPTKFDLGDQPERVAKPLGAAIRSVLGATAGEVTA